VVWPLKTSRPGGRGSSHRCAWTPSIARTRILSATRRRRRVGVCLARYGGLRRTGAAACDAAPCARRCAIRTPTGAAAVSIRLPPARWRRPRARMRDGGITRARVRSRRAVPRRPRIAPLPPTPRGRVGRPARATAPSAASSAPRGTRPADPAGMVALVIIVPRVQERPATSARPPRLQPRSAPWPLTPQGSAGRPARATARSVVLSALRGTRPADPAGMVALVIIVPRVRERPATRRRPEGGARSTFAGSARRAVWIGPRGTSAAGLVATVGRARSAPRASRVSPELPPGPSVACASPPAGAGVAARGRVAGASSRWSG